MIKPSNSLRKAAILVSSLDRQSADALLDSMPDELSARVRQAVLNLDDIDPAEQQTIIAEFLKGKDAAPPGGVEFESSLVRKFSAPGSTEPESAAPSPPAAESPAHFRVLQGATRETLCKFLLREHPQTIALVVAHLPPDRAADVLEGLSSSLQADVLKRVSELEETSPDVLQELERSFEHLLASEAQASRRRTIGLAAVGAILSAAPDSVRRGMLSNLARTDSDLADRLDAEGELDSGAVHSTPAAKPRRFGFPWTRFGVAASPAASINSKVDDDFDDDVEPNEIEQEVAPKPAPPMLPSVEFEDFLRFDNRSLALVLKSADPRIAMLALTGARHELVERLLKQLPSQEAKELRKRMELSGPLRLRDVEIAQQQLALVASKLAAKGQIKLPGGRRFMVAA